MAMRRLAQADPSDAADAQEEAAEAKASGNAADILDAQEEMAELGMAPGAAPVPAPAPGETACGIELASLPACLPDWTTLGL